MDSFSTFFLFATALACGSAALLVPVPPRGIGRRFFVMMSLVSLIFLALAIVDRGLGLAYPYLIFAAALVAYNVFLPRQAEDPGHKTDQDASPPAWSMLVSMSLLCLAAVAGAWALSSDALTYARAIEPVGLSRPELVATFLSSSLLIGASIVTMTLGHWYLVVKGIGFGPIRRLTALLWVTIVIRIGVSAMTLWGQWEVWAAMVEKHGWTAFFLSEGVFISSRALFGLAAPFVMMFLVWGCLRVKSNQSATGILYVIVVFVFLGELLSKYYMMSGLVF